MAAMTGKSDDARTPEDEQARVDSAWDELLDGADTAESSDSSATEDRPHPGGHNVVGKDRVSDPEREMDRLMFGAPPPLSKKGADKKAAPTKGIFEKKSESSDAMGEEADGGAGESDEAKDASDDEQVEADAADDAKGEAAQNETEADADEASDAKSDDTNEEASSEKADADTEANDAKGDAADEETSSEKADTADEAASDEKADDAEDKTTAATDESASDAKADTEDDESSSDAKPDAEDEGDADESDAESKETESTESKSSRRPALRVVSDDEAADEDEAPKASRPIETFAETPAANDTGGPPWGWIGIGVLAVGAAIAFAMGGDEPTKPGPKPAATASAESPRAADPTPNDPIPTPTDPKPTEPTPAGDESTAAEPPESGTSTGGSDPNGPPLGDQPRVAPPGTSPEAAAAFLRLPVSPSDRPPVGGVGAKGIHIDHIAMGSQVVGGTCKGRSDGFSVSRREVASVCVRVVHQRTKEELQLLWQKHGGSTRRSKIVVQPKHAYRTRGHLKLREEYIGDWTVRILSSDDVELARHDFTVAP